MCDNTNPSTQSIADYLAQLLKDRKQLAAFPNVFMHMERLLDEDVSAHNDDQMRVAVGSVEVWKPRLFQSFFNT
ncbi:unnamed protein product [Pieris macdunnoughi]|uniref:STAR protein homodimerisation region domain-containing protein n=1 Tax=Pieris macdunnoughi TaxID=345717 RepID=A0A821V5F5_9NEOP|nr:unnamed protein product [Pieris macdunnoughi]